MTSETRVAVTGDVVREMTVETNQRPADYDDQTQIFEWVPEHRIPRTHRLYCQKHVDRLAAEHGLGKIGLRWFRLAQDQRVILRMDDDRVTDVWAVGDPRTIFPLAGGKARELTVGLTRQDDPTWVALDADLRGELVLVTIGHEIAHLLQFRDQLEADHGDATRFGVRYLDRVAGAV